MYQLSTRARSGWSSDSICAVLGRTYITAADASLTISNQLGVE